jgi:hypothetical protein
MRGEFIISWMRPESVKTVSKSLTVREGRVKRSDFGRTLILFSHENVTNESMIIVIRKRLPDLNAEPASLVLVEKHVGFIVSIYLTPFRFCS